MARQQSQDWKVLGLIPGIGKKNRKKYFLLFVVGCFGSNEIQLKVFAVFLQINVVINSHGDWEEGTFYP